MTITETPTGKIDWQDWLMRWHRQQENYLPDRTRRFEIMLDFIDRQRGDEPLRLLDLCSGPGSIGEIALRRFGQATVLAVDIDPLLIEMGRQTIGQDGDIGPRISWLEADLRQENWWDSLEPGSFDAIFSATAIHWFWPEDLVRLYRDLASLLAPGGLFLNADHLPAGKPTLGELSLAEMQRYQTAQLAAPGAESWAQYWEVAAAEPAFAGLLAERERRFANRKRSVDLPVSFHREILELAGFREAGEIWRYYNDAILLGIR